MSHYTEKDQFKLISIEKLEKIISESYDKAFPYTGEYWMGKADLANELLGKEPIDWDAHPQSIENLIRSSKAREVK